MCFYLERSKGVRMTLTFPFTAVLQRQLFAVSPLSQTANGFYALCGRLTPWWMICLSFQSSKNRTDQQWYKYSRIPDSLFQDFSMCTWFWLAAIARKLEQELLSGADSQFTPWSHMYSSFNSDHNSVWTSEMCQLKLAKLCSPAAADNFYLLFKQVTRSSFVCTVD